MFHIVRRTIFAGLLLPMLAACDGPPFKDFQDSFGLTQARLLNDGWAKPYDVTEDPVFCYRTIAGSDCYDRPVPGEEHRLVRDPSPPVE